MGDVMLVDVDNEEWLALRIRWHVFCESIVHGSSGCIENTGCGVSAVDVCIRWPNRGCAKCSLYGTQLLTEFLRMLWDLNERGIENYL